MFKLIADQVYEGEVLVGFYVCRTFLPLDDYHNPALLEWLCNRSPRPSSSSPFPSPCACS